MSGKVNRRKLLVGAGSAGLIASSGVAPAYAQNKRRLKMVTTWPKNFPWCRYGSRKCRQAR
jgi:hypothetical protein